MQNLTVHHAGKVAAVALLALTAASLISLPAANATQATTIRWKGSSADAYLNSEDNGVYTDVYVFATDSAYRQTKASFNESVAYVYVYQYTLNQVCEVYDGQEYCWYDYIPILAFDGYTNLDAQAFQMSRLNTATLQTTLTGFDWVSNTEKTIAVDAAWTGVGATSSGNWVYNYRSGDYMFHEQFVGSSRQADVSISISGDITTDVDSSSASYGYATLSNAKSGYVDITR